MIQLYYKEDLDTSLTKRNSFHNIYTTTYPPTKPPTNQPPHYN